MSNLSTEEVGIGVNTHNNTTISSDNSADSRGAHREIDIEPNPNVEPSSATNDTMNDSGSSSRPWRLDLDLNFDPSWLVSRNATTGVRQLHGPLSMLNDWVRNSIPGNNSTPAAVSTAVHPSAVANNPVGHQSNSNPNLVSQGRRGSLPAANNNGPVLDCAHHSQAGPCRSYNRSRSSPHHQSRSATSAGENQEDVQSGGDSQTYVVDMESATTASTTWSNSANENRIIPDDREPSSHASSPAESPSSENAPSEILRLRQSPEARALIHIVERYTPFVLILFIKGIFDHGSGILCFMALLITFSHANSLFKKEVAKQSKRNIFYVAMIIVNLLICIAFMYYVFEEQKLYPALACMNTNLELNNIWTLFWVVGVTDYVAKFLTIIVKSIFLALPERVTPFQKRGKYYLFVEQTSQLYRCILPIHPWFFFLFESYEGSLQVFGFILTGLYVLFKIGDIVQRLKSWKVALGKLLQQVHYGTSPSVEQMANVGANCPICHDTFNHPTRLSCTHIFCEECVSTWFDRERTCPMCRAKVVDDPSFRDGSTTHFIQLF